MAGFNYLQPFAPGQQPGNPWATMGAPMPPPDGNPPQPVPTPPPGGGVDGHWNPGTPDRTMAMPSGTPEPTPATGGYTPEQFGTWYAGANGGQAPSQDLINRIGGAVGAPAGPNGTFSAAQWQQAQQMAANGGQPPPFFSEFQAPKYEAGPAYQAPAAFQAPSMEQALADPGYQFSVQQGQKRLEGSAAARGLARTGGTLKNLMDYGQQAAGAQYDKVYGRAASEYAQNYQMGRDTWGANQAQRDATFDRNYKGASDAFNSRFRGQELSFQDLFNRWNVGVNTQTQLALNY